LALHILVVALVTGFMALAWWQLRRAAAGNLVSFGYALEWPLFAGFTIVVWIRAIRDRINPPETAAHERATRAAAPPPPSRPVLPPRPAPAPVPEDDDVLAAYNNYLASLDAHEPTR
jgi:DNA-binding transcriptional regulator of glucitol operon